MASDRSLKEKTLQGLVWSAMSQGGRQICQLVITAVLARLLLPSDFGLVAMAAVFVNFAALFSEMGMGVALIQKQDAHDRHYSSAFWFSIAIGIGLTVLFAAVAPLIAGFYDQPELKPILTVVSLNFILSSFTVIQQTLLTKSMDFKSLAIRDIAAVVVSGAVGIASAINGFGAWSLVYQMLAFTAVSSVLLWTLSSWRPQFAFAQADIRDIFRFSANVTGFNFVNYFARNIDQLLIGKILGAAPLGYYTLAYKIMIYPLQNVSWVIAKVMFPAMSLIQDQDERVRDVYLKTVRLVSMVTFPAMTILLVLAEDLVRLFLGEKWLPIVPLLQIFCFCGMIQSVGTLMGNLMLAKDRSGLHLKLGLCAASFTTMAVLLGLKWGIVGVTMCYTIAQFFWLPYAQSKANALVRISWFSYLSQLRWGLGLSLVAAAVTWTLRRALP